MGLLENLHHLILVGLKVSNQDPFKKNKSLFLHYADLTDFSSLNSVICNIKPDEVYNLADSISCGCFF